MKQNLAYLDAMGIDVWIRRENVTDPVNVAEILIEEAVEAENHSTPHVEIKAPEVVSKKNDHSSLDIEPEVVTEPHSVTIENDSWQQLQQRLPNCTDCELHQSRTQTVFGVGNHHADWLIIGEAPGAEEDRLGEPFVGRAGQLLNTMLMAVGQQREEVFIANILKCRPPNNRDPRPEEVFSCEPYLQRQIALIQPKVILCVGRVAAQNLLKIDTPIGQMRGKKYSYAALDIPVVVTYHPAYLLRKPSEKGKSWQDLLLAKSIIDAAKEDLS